MNKHGRHFTAEDFSSAFSEQEANIAAKVLNRYEDVLRMLAESDANPENRKQEKWNPIAFPDGDVVHTEKAPIKGRPNRPIAIDQAIELNARIVSATGGTCNVRDIGLLESALAQPFQGFGDVDFHPEISNKAACYLYDLIENHSFSDANKRTAFIVSMTYLENSGCTVDVAGNELYELVLGIAAGEIKQNQVNNWMRVHVIDGHLKPEELEYVEPELVQESEQVAKMDGIAH